MNKLAMTVIAASLVFAAPVSAEEAHHPEKAGEAKNAPAQPAPQVKKMQDNVKKMPTQLDRIAKAKTDEARQKAMAEHMQTMQENMKMAHDMNAGMMDCQMMEGGMMGKGGMAAMHGGMMGKGGMAMMGGGSAPADAPDRMQQMEKRMDMMQMMMEQMMRRQEGAASTTPMPMK